MRVMAIDYGDAHTGVALSDPTGFLTGSTHTIHSRKAQVVLDELVRLIRERQVDELYEKKLRESYFAQGKSSYRSGQKKHKRNERER